MKKRRRDNCACCGERMWDALVCGPGGGSIHVRGCVHCDTRYEQPIDTVQLPDTLPMFEVDE